MAPSMKRPVIWRFSLFMVACVQVCWCNLIQRSIDRAASDITIVPSGYQFKEVGSKIVFTCIVGEQLFSSGDGESSWPQIKWKDPGQALIEENQKRIYTERVDAYKSKLYITKVEGNDAGLYTCEVNTRDGLMFIVSNNLFIFADIQFLPSKTKVTAVVGSSPLIDCEAIGNPQPDISWKFNGKKISKDDIGRYSIQRDGLRIRGLEVTDAGSYECRAQVMSQGNFKTLNIDLDVEYAPILNLPLYSPTVIKGSEAKLLCQASGNPAVSYQWFRGNAKSGMQLYKGLNAEYLLKNVGEDDEGEYTCVVSNKYGSQEGTVDLRVSVPPKVKVPEQYVTVLEGKDLVLPCEAVSSPLATFHWNKRSGNKSITYQSTGSAKTSGDRVFVKTSDVGVSKLKIREATRSDAGDYSCTAVNDAGSDSKDIKVVVDFVPVVHLKTDAEVYAWSGEVRILTCLAFGHPLPGITWIRGDNTYLGSTPHHTIITNKQSSDSASSSLKLMFDEQLENSMYSNYSCTAKNLHGFDSKAVVLKKAYPPELPRNLSVTNITHESFSLRTAEGVQSVPSEPAVPPVITWIIKYKKVLPTVHAAHLTLSTPKGTEFTVKSFDAGSPMFVEGLEASTEYLVLISARNKVGESGPVKFNVQTVEFPEGELFQADQGLMSRSSLTRQEHLRLNKDIDERRRAKSFWDGLSMGIVVVVVGLLAVLTAAVLAFALRNRRERLPVKSGKYRIGSPDKAQFDYSSRGQQMKITDEHDIDSLMMKSNRPMTSVNDGSPFAELQNRYGSLPKKFGDGMRVIRPFDVVNNNVNDGIQQQQQQGGGLDGKVAWPLSSTLPRSKKMEVHVNRTASVMQMIEEENKTKQSQAWKEMMKLTTDLDDDSMISREENDDDDDDGGCINEGDNNSAEDEGVFEGGQHSDLPPPPSDMLSSPIKPTQNFLVHQRHYGLLPADKSTVNTNCKQGPFDASHIEDEDDISFIDDDDDDDDVVITDHSCGNSGYKKVQFEGKSFRQ